MKKIYFMPGPSQIYPHLKEYMKEAFIQDIMSISHRSDRYMAIAKGTVQGLRSLLNIPLSHHVFFMSSSLESMERVISNCVHAQSYHFVNGSFAQAFEQAAISCGVKTTVHRFEPGEHLDMNRILIPHQTELICITQNETSNGSAIPMNDIYALKKRYPRISIALDVVSSAPYPRIDFKRIDIAFFSVQKGFGLPSGLGILVVNDNQVQNAKRTGYHDFPSLAKKEVSFQTPETPNVLSIFLLGKVVEDMIKEKLSVIRKATEEKAKLVEECVSRNRDVMKFFITDRKVRSRTVLVIDLGKYAEYVVDQLKLKGIIVGKGYGQYKTTQIRIANFPQHSKKDFHKLIVAMEAVLSRVRE